MSESHQSDYININPVSEKKPIKHGRCCGECTCYHMKSRPPTSDGAEGVDVFGGEQGSRQLPDELLQQRCSIVRIHLIPAELSRVETGFQLLLQQLHFVKIDKM